MKQIILSSLIASTFLFSGCAQKVTNEYFMSNENFVQDETNNFILANDFIDFADDYYNPSTTKFVIDHENNASSFSRTIESRLREKGYGVGYANMNETAWLAWKITTVDENTIVATYHIQDSKFTKTYTKNHGKFAPVGSFSIFNEPKKRAVPVVEELPPVEPVIELTPIAQKIKENDVWETFVNKASYLHIRKEPTIKSKVMGTLKKGTLIEVDSDFDNNKWMKIEAMDGYVAKRYLKYLHPKNEGDLVYAPKK